jgi:ketosteroid isomerase-like protein
MGLTPPENVEQLVRSVFRCIEAKDLSHLMDLFADDAVLIDPHFPDPRLVGREAIAEALAGAFVGMEAFGYTIDRYFETRDGTSAAVETSTHHVVRKGMKLDFPQTFVFDVKDGRVSRMQAYEPYGPHGLLGMFLSVGRAMRRIGRFGRSHARS